MLTRNPECGKGKADEEGKLHGSSKDPEEECERPA